MGKRHVGRAARHYNHEPARISNEKLVTLTFKVPKSRVAAIERVAKEKGETKSEFLRSAVDKALIAS